MKQIRGLHPYRSLEEDDEVMIFEDEIRKQKRLWKRPKVIATIVTGLLVLMVVVATVTLCTSVEVPKAAEPIPPIVETTCGKVVGQREKGSFVFMGIPYAKPPGRWRSPEPLTPLDGCWRGEYQAKMPRSQCLQDNFEATKTNNEDAPAFLGSEDCLYLNVWTPSLNQKPKPVIVYIHHGFLRWGSGLEPTFTPTPQMAQNFDAVFVSLNYRLYALGFLALNALSRDSASGRSGNYGLQDQIMALRWIRENIRNFGGDPDKVTLLGQGSGASSIVGLLTSGAVRNLFHGAWLSSPSPFINTTLRVAAGSNTKLLNSNCSTASCLRAMSGEEVQRMALPYWDCHDCYNLPVLGSFDQAMLIVDGDTVPFPTQDALSRGLVNDVPIVIGSMAQEVDNFPPPGAQDWEWDTYKKFVAQHLDTFNKSITATALKLYNDSLLVGSTTPTPERVITTMISDVRLICPTNHLVSTIEASFTSPVFRYVATAGPSAEVHAGEACRYACHMWDLVAIFGSIRSYIPHPSRADDLFQIHMQASLRDFVHNGRVKYPGWMEVPNVAIINDLITFKPDPYHEDACKFWLVNGFLPYAWKN